MWTRTGLPIAVFGAAAMLSVVLTAGCGGSATEPAEPARREGLLRLVKSASELEASIKAGIKSPPVTDPTAMPAASYSGTYTHELRVDELDTVRYDGAHLYVAPARMVTCCFSRDPTLVAAPPPPTSARRAIRILRTDRVGPAATQVGSIALDQGVSVQGLYLATNRLVALTSESYYGSFGPAWTSLPVWAPTHLGLRILDVTDAAHPRETFSAEIDGVFVESRRIGNRVIVVSRYTPSQLLDEAARQAIDSVPLDALLPRITINGVSKRLVDPANCYVTTNEPDRGYAVLTTITVFPIDDPGAFVSACYDEVANGVYVAENALYVSQPRFVETTQKTVTRIHKFDLTATVPAYRGSAEVPGAVWTGGQLDFRLSERAGLLRVVTTEYLSDTSDSVDHRLVVLRQSASAPELEIASELPNARRPEEIGKPNEMLYGVRFLGDRLYAISFLRVDPLYVLDLADPQDPRIVGTLEVPGFQDFLHPVTTNLLLGIGEGAEGGVRVALFDVSTLAQPRELGGVTLGGRGSWSEARADRHAFVYLAGSAGVDRFAIPADLFSEDNQFRYSGTGLHLFEIRGKETAALATLHEIGRIVPRGAGGSPLEPGGRNRAFIDGDAVFYARDDDVWAAPWTAPEASAGPF